MCVGRISVVRVVTDSGCGRIACRAQVSEEHVEAGTPPPRWQDLLALTPQLAARALKRWLARQLVSSRATRRAAATAAAARTVAAQRQAARTEELLAKVHSPSERLSARMLPCQVLLAQPRHCPWKAR